MVENNNSKAVLKRSDVPVEETWNLEDIYATDDDWNKEFNEIKEMIPKITAFEGKVTDSADAFYNVLHLDDEISIKLGKLYTYAHMRYDQDTTNSFYQELNDRASMLATEVASRTAFIVPEILAVEESKIQGFLNENPNLQVYKHWVDELNRKRPHILSAREEAILAQASEVLGSSNDTFGKLNNADIQFPSIKNETGEDVEVTHGRFILFLESDDRRVREDAFKSVYSTYGKFKNTFASTLSGNIKKDNFYAKVKNYKTARESSLNRNNIPESVYDTLVDTIGKNLNLLQRYVALRKKLLGVDELHMYDLYTPLIKDVKMEFKYKEAQEVILKSLEPMGEEYISIVQEGFNNRWIDVHENVGKRSGAYSSGAYGTNPYILMNWQDNVNNLFTLTHELGHSVHSYYSRKTQPYPYSGYSIFVAEVASTCNEALLNEYLLKNTTDENEKLYLLNHYLEGFRGTVFRQTMFAEFEHIIHERAMNGDALTADRLTEIYYGLNEKYFGKDITIDKEIGLEWARIPHFYYNYYVYQYATGYSAAQALSKQILEEGKPAVDRYINGFLKAGSSDYPIEVLKNAGVDMTSSEPIEQALKVFDEKLTEMEQLLK